MPVSHYGTNRSKIFPPWMDQRVHIVEFVISFCIAKSVFVPDTDFLRHILIRHWLRVRYKQLF